MNATWLTWLGIDRLTAKQRNALLWGMGGLFGFRVLCASLIPFGNDEVYYWDWGRNLLLSYFDHPPMVAWIARIGSLIAPDTLLGARFLVPFMHLGASILVYRIGVLFLGHSLAWGEAVSLFFVTQILPIFSIGGFLLMPDAGLIFFLSLVAWLWVSIYRQVMVANAWTGAVSGLCMGLAVCSKYHALPMLGLGAVAFLVVRWRERRRIDTAYWLAVLLVALMAMLPVIVWNHTNNWVSLRYQSDHGLGGLHFDALPGLRNMFALTLLLSPGGVYQIGFGIVRAWKMRHLANGSRILLAMGVPLAAFLVSVSFFKDGLPHWVLPAIWILVPLAVFVPHGRLSKLVRMNLGLCLIFGVMMPMVLTIPGTGKTLVKVLDNHPGALAEFTLWPDLVADMGSWPEWQSMGATRNGQNDLGPSGSSQKCPPTGYVASLRWFWSSQLSWYLPGRPTVLNLDQSRLSYQHFRDAHRHVKGCTVTIIADAGHYDAAAVRRLITVSSERTLLVPSHLDRPIVVLVGEFIHDQLP